MNEILWNLAAFVIAIAILVTFHEWGHFLFARLFKVDVLRFSIGFGKPLCRWQGRKGTEYVIAALPLGGYVKMLDEREGPVPAERLPYAFNRQVVAKRLAIVMAGPLFNFIFALLAYWLMLINGVEQAIPIVGEVEKNSIAAHAKLRPGDEIIAIEGDAIDSWRQVIEKLVLYGKANSTLTLEVKQPNQQQVKHILALDNWSLSFDKGSPIEALGITPYQPKLEPIIAAISENEPADIAGLQEGDKIVSIDNQSAESWESFVEMIQQSPNKTLTITILRDGKTVTKRITPRVRDDSDEPVGFVGITPVIPDWPADKIRMTQYSVIDAIIPAIDKTWEMTKLTGMLLYKLVTGFISTDTISGPIGIAQGAGASASGGFSQYLSFLGLVSISLAILNLLPIPVLDGGHILYYLIESIRGKPISEKAQEIGFKFGLILLVLLMGLAFYNDIVRLIPH